MSSKEDREQRRPPHGPTILVVEDERLVALDIQTRLTELGYVVVTASSAEEATELAVELRPDLILMDVKLGDGPDGIEAAQRIREVLDVPFIYLTAYADDSTLDRARATKPYGYLLKPFNVRELRATIEMSLQRHWTDRYERVQDELQRFLADATTRLAESLEYQTVVGRAMDLLIPRWADSCLLCLKAGEHIPALSLIHPEPSAAEAPTSAEGSVVASVLRDGEPLLHETIPDSASLAELLGRRHLSVLRSRQILPRSLLCVPLRARERILGAILLVSAGHNHRYDRVDLEWAQNFARRFSMAIDNALLYRQEQRALAMREEVLAVVSHDLRNPLFAILMSASTLAEEPTAPPELRVIRRAAQRMDRMTRDLLDAASIDAGHLSLEQEECSATSLLGEAVEGLRPLAEKKSLALVIRPIHEEALVLCDRDRIIQVLGNLIGNAIKYTPAEGSISVWADSNGSQTRFYVADSGPGIPSAQCSHLFERFWRGETRQKGAGLGLFIARGIVEAHHGSIGVASAVGQGSTFYFQLPSAPSASAVAGSP